MDIKEGQEVSLKALKLLGLKLVEDDANDLVYFMEDNRHVFYVVRKSTGYVEYRRVLDNFTESRLKMKIVPHRPYVILIYKEKIEVGKNVRGMMYNIKTSEVRAIKTCGFTQLIMVAPIEPEKAGKLEIVNTQTGSIFKYQGSTEFQLETSLTAGAGANIGGALILKTPEGRTIIVNPNTFEIIEENATNLKYSFIDSGIILYSKVETRERFKLDLIDFSKTLV
jgi:hypothetical protein